MARTPTTRTRGITPLRLKRAYTTDQYVRSTGAVQELVHFRDYFPEPELRGTQITTSEGHPWSRRTAGTADIGGDFYTSSVAYGGDSRVKFQTVRTFPTGFYSKYVEKYDGPLFPLSPVGLAFPPSAASSNASLDALGATAVARCEPTNSVADLSTFLGELMKDGLPSLVGSSVWKARTSAAKSAGGEFLNVEFGWLPLVSDIRKFSESVAHANAVLKQYERDAGKVVRRQYHFPPIRTKVVSTVKTGVIPYGDGSGLCEQIYGRGNVIRTRETVLARWFSGAFTYHLPSGYDSRDGMARKALFAKQVLGARLTPEVIWNLAPWSWAVDWFSNVGDVLHNVSHWTSNGLVMRYGYMMETSIVTDTYTFEPNPASAGYRSLPPLVLVNTTKKRRRANPFGFGLTWDGLSPLQMAIAAALGMSRSR